MKKSVIFLLTTLTFSLGVIAGFMLSPVKKGIIISGIGSTGNNYGKEHIIADEE